MATLTAGLMKNSRDFSSENVKIEEELRVLLSRRSDDQCRILQPMGWMGDVQYLQRLSDLRSISRRADIASLLCRLTSPARGFCSTVQLSRSRLRIPIYLRPFRLLQECVFPLPVTTLAVIELQRLTRDSTWPAIYLAAHLHPLPEHVPDSASSESSKCHRMAGKSRVTVSHAGRPWSLEAGVRRRNEINISPFAEDKRIISDTNRDSPVDADMTTKGTAVTFTVAPATETVELTCDAMTSSHPVASPDSSAGKCRSDKGRGLLPINQGQGPKPPIHPSCLTGVQYNVAHPLSAHTSKTYCIAETEKPLVRPVACNRGLLANQAVLVTSPWRALDGTAAFLCGGGGADT
ncbi:hypothetical protein RRG08_059191 [Elysia crispata]|uniref:Uncharacterized protein n=1 Tax=Elysia crispata TaxID=231223 RepID=A0AAE0ZED3_9GAST|nr:hypothetical protein RRG08_059191 [Elysia crispata]